MSAEDFDIYLKKRPWLDQLIIYRRQFIAMEETTKYI